MLSICIVNWNTRDYLRECLASLAAYPPEGEDSEVIVVDNASTDGSAAMVAEEFPDVQLIAMPDNVGYADGNNIALRRSIGDVLLMLNPDVLLSRHTLTNALAFLRSQRSAAAISVLFRNPDGTIQPSLRGFPSPAALFWEISGIRRLLPWHRDVGSYFMSWFHYDRVVEADQPMGTFLMIPRSAYEQIGELDDEFPIFFNEVDWCYRAKQRGWRIYFTPDAEIVHYGGQGTRRAPKAAMIRESHRALIRFYDKYYRATTPPLLYALITTAIRAACAVRVLSARR